jgi:hypothetical protein
MGDFLDEIWRATVLFPENANANQEQDLWQAEGVGVYSGGDRGLPRF